MAKSIPSICVSEHTGPRDLRANKQTLGSVNTVSEDYCEYSMLLCVFITCSVPITKTNPSKTTKNEMKAVPQRCLGNRPNEPFKNKTLTHNYFLLFNAHLDLMLSHLQLFVAKNLLVKPVGFT